MRWITTVAIIACVLLCLYCTFSRGLPSLSNIPVPDEAPAFPTMEPITLSKPILVVEPTGAPLYLYSEAIATRDT
jgi:hypothetical protein